MPSSGRAIPRVLKVDDDDVGRPRVPHQNHYDLNSKIMLTAIISLSIVVLLVLALHIYARYVLRRQERRRRAALRHLGLTVAESRSASEPPPPKTGLEPSVIASLPLFAFNNSSSRSSTNTDPHNHSSECAVCLSNLEEGEMARLLPNCNHSFHAECIDKWLSSRSTCPICRTEAEPRPRLEPEPREGLVGSSGGNTAPPPTAPPLERLNSMSSCVEGTSDAANKISNGTSSGSNRLSSFRRILSRERSSRRIQPCGQDQDVIQDLERQQFNIINYKLISSFFFFFWVMLQRMIYEEIMHN
ncbi:LOW QUALITY PROTEIN: 43kDa postsynaptic protein [Trema orientale]|uniref:RING-type E3 ubiquitin transferase n=1 Tax=Trema orientale TaxID=63057 RepID=A0A2P5E7T8_TREOI|nr:LOW QUALITY PROTEIN: 43kDa postsynaptic protein [Trema orientale]